MRGGKWWECWLEGCGGQGHGGPHGCVELGRQAEGCLVHLQRLQLLGVCKCLGRREQEGAWVRLRLQPK